MIRIIRTETYEEMSRRAAGFIAAQIMLKPDSVLGLATGTTPIGTYQELIRKNQEGELDFSGVRTVNLDEYQGLAPDHPQSYRRFMDENLFRQVNIVPENTHVPDGAASDLHAACCAYDELIRSLGGIDLQLLGIGRNGHIGFNEPSDAFEVGTNVVDLTQSTINANARLFDSPDDVPRRAVTMGTAPIMGARRILLIANGENKAPALRDALTGPVSPRMPASVIQLHPDVTVIADRAALSLLKM